MESERLLAWQCTKMKTWTCTFKKKKYLSKAYLSKIVDYNDKGNKSMRMGSQRLGQGKISLLGQKRKNQLKRLGQAKQFEGIKKFQKKLASPPNCNLKEEKTQILPI